MGEVERDQTFSERSGSEILRKERDVLLAQPFLLNVISNLPNICFIINGRRQVLVANDSLNELLELEKDDQIVGLRPGEIFSCIHSRRSTGGCGTSDVCQFCEVLNTVLDSNKSKRTEQREARLIVDQDGREGHLDMQVTCSPLEILDMTFFMVTMVDITSEKRRKVMEKVFFHDALNLVHVLDTSLLLTEEYGCSDRSIQTLKNGQKIVRSLASEINFQKTLLSAEIGDLQLNTSSINSIDLMKDTMDHLMDSKESLGKSLVIEKEAENFPLKTDLTLFRRVLLNMIKNALEASGKGSEVKLNCRSIDGNALFSVWNDCVIPKDVQAQLWQRSFSTKGEDRGIGTYSMKLFIEQYLGGKISFTSKDGEGTTFIASIPL